jgi:hypothetical protein
MSSHPTSEHTSQRDPKPSREEGAVLMIVVLMLLVVTATGTYAVHATTAELRGAGGTRTAYQTESMAVALTQGAIDWVDRVGPAALYRQATMNDRAGRGLNLTGAEPVMLATGQLGTRLYPSDLNSTIAGASSPVEIVGASSLNNAAPQTATGVVDVYDMYRYSGATAGERSDGYGALFYLRATYTARARTFVDVGVSASQDIRDRQVTTATARAAGTSGPFSM